ncbi:hypothetical protein Kpol_2001p69 [Vanderwaltozyma polyspora DSM 70294]|uniref:ERAD-associated E3 ubiquitin-protein ligase component HRD3 n=1 Tax=Vanderwaltozyma polyspora (strain ATCC 22028 / DSM 70294 / BCRC 21397 / CBS 2163 / NBRC 10782 / NRRL Y-8283 / UCD 57-17) TaxID=436907 RepID=A7TGU9_VANPO|nr:uncharacterized protein Kpol_2001p69 [Vanderwaltozyma polyspora DSM 70294]EDO18562.1 hypothetical protein Kpol_2001p69 [Vanderwaltozyma polyspora DSM 70294]
MFGRSLLVRSAILLGLLNNVLCDDILDPYNKAIEIFEQNRPPPGSDFETFADYDGFYDDIELFIPIDYSLETQEKLYLQFWSESILDWQKSGYSLLVESSEKFDNINATYLLAQLNLWGHYGFPQNKTLAFKYLDAFNEMTNFTNSTALFDLAVMHSTGFFGTIPTDIGKSVLYYQKAASLGDLRAKQALAYRYSSGLNVPRDCNLALLLYRELSEEIRDEIPNEDWEIQPSYFETFDIRLPDFNGGLLGEHLSSMSSSITRLDAARPSLTSSMLTQMNGGQIVLQFGLGGGIFVGDSDDDSDDRLVDIYYTAWDKYQGTYDKRRNVVAARVLLELAYKDYHLDVPIMNNLQKYFFGKCLYLLGHIYFTGDGLEKRNVELAEHYLKQSISLIDNVSTIKSKANIDLGLINHYFKHDLPEAIKYYKNIYDSNNNDGTVDYQLSKLAKAHPEFELGDPFVFMQSAYRRSHIPATFEYARMVEEGANNHYSCENTAFLFKRFVELNENIMAPQLEKAFRELAKGNVETALWAYSQAAEQGYEAAQVSAAYLLYPTAKLLEDPPETTKERKFLAISYYNRAFKQNNVDAATVSGNIYYDMCDYQKALSMYQSGSLRFSPQAMWNLGYMYEYGLGVERNYTAARNYYNQVIEHDPNLYLAGKASVLKLYIKSLFSWVTGKDSETYWELTTPTNGNNVEAHRSWFRKLMLSFKKAGLENVGQNESNSQNKNKEMSKPIIKRILDYIDSMGIDVEDLFSILFMIVIFITSMIIRTIAIRRGWNVRVNGVPIQQQRQEEPNFNIQFFAI